MSGGTLTPTEKTNDELHRHSYVPTHTALSGVFGSGSRSGAHHGQPPRAGLEPALQWRRDLRRHRGATTGRRVHCAAPPHRPRRLTLRQAWPPGTAGRPRRPYPSSATSRRVTADRRRLRSLPVARTPRISAPSTAEHLQLTQACHLGGQVTERNGPLRKSRPAEPPLGSATAAKRP